MTEDEVREKGRAFEKIGRFLVDHAADLAPLCIDIQNEVSLWPFDKLEVAQKIVRTMCATGVGPVRKCFGTALFMPVADFGGVVLRALFDRSAVCRCKVVGVRKVPARPAVPEQEEEIVEWDCESILGEDGQ